jgi:hypothetical protein
MHGIIMYLLFCSTSIQMCVLNLFELNVSRNVRYDIVSTPSVPVSRNVCIRFIWSK